MWLVLCSSDDFGALWAARELRARGLNPLEVVTDRALAYNTGLAHRITPAGAAVRLVLADGRVIDGAAVQGALNRLQRIPTEHLLRASDADRQYAEQELYALFLSWLYGLPCPMLNRPTPLGLSGAWYHPSELSWFAAQAGLPARPFRQSDLEPAPMAGPFPFAPKHTIIVIRDVCCGPSAPPAVSQGCVHFAQLCETALVGIEFQVSPTGEWWFHNATPFPDLRLGGPALAAALASELRQ